MKPTILSLPVLLFLALSAAGQQKEVRWQYEYKQQGWCASGLPSFEVTFYRDNTFDYKTKGWGIGSGTYEVKDSALICTYSGKSPLPQTEEGWVEALYPSEDKHEREVIVLDGKGREPLIGAEVALLTADGATIQTLTTDFDGRCILPRIPFSGVRAAYMGYKTEEAFVYPGSAVGLAFYLTPGQQQRIIAKGGKHQFRIRRIQGREIILEPVETRPIITISP